jgi:RNA recognition motif-containing protein
MSPGLLFESFSANIYGGQQMPSKLYVGNLAYSVSKSDLEGLFSQAGQVQSVAIIMDKFSGQSKGFGFVEMASADDAAKAIQQFNDTELKGRNIKVNEAKPRESSFGGSNRGGGGGGSDRGRNRW